MGLIGKDERFVLNLSLICVLTSSKQILLRQIKDGCEADQLAFSLIAGPLLARSAFPTPLRIRDCQLLSQHMGARSRQVSRC